MVHRPRPRKTSMKTSPMYLVVLAALLLAGCARESPPSDAKLAALRARLDAAQTQADMNGLSAEISQHQDRKLAKLEERVRNDLHDEELKAELDKASALWREYRHVQAEFEGDMYRGGSVQPLVRNEAFTRLTEERIAALISAMGPEQIYREDGQGGWLK